MNGNEIDELIKNVANTADSYKHSAPIQTIIILGGILKVLGEIAKILLKENK